MFVPTSRKLLDAAAFHDGRTELGNGEEPAIVSIDAAVRWYRETAGREKTQRFIVHGSFCGSTLLARCLGSLENGVSYREPQALIELADGLRAGGPSIASGIQPSELSEFVFGQFQKTWHEPQVAIVKPSNWVNGFVSSFLQSSSPARIITMQQKIESYLLANIRGGKPRLRYSLNLLNRVVQESDYHREAVACVERAGKGDMASVLRLLCVCFDYQESAVAAIARSTEKHQVLNVTKSELLASPADCVAQAASFFAIPHDVAQVRRVCAASLTTNAKLDSVEPWRAEDEEAMNERIKADFRGDLNETLRWYEESIMKN
ncbi:MAG: hypothetical protein KJO31_02535 [Gammaproteobacteria bacterium]|nr:hypothetical protein [Gammaproteobacteria bacterium]